MENKYPRTLYKAGGSKKWGGDKFYTDIIVVDEDEQEAAGHNGFVDSFHDALFGAAEAQDDPVKEPEGDLTKPEIMQALDRMEIPYNPRDKKGVLEEILKKNVE